MEEIADRLRDAVQALVTRPERVSVAYAAGSRSALLGVRVATCDVMAVVGPGHTTLRALAAQVREWAPEGTKCSLYLVEDSGAQSFTEAV